MRTALLGVGLIGGSIGLALRQAGWPVGGWGPNRRTLELAAGMGAIDRVASSAGAAVAQAELVVLAGPIRALPGLLRSVAAAASPGTVVTDVASVKEQVMRWAAELLPAHVDFVGGHPMAGKERQGIASAEAGLLRGRTYCLVPSVERPGPGSDRALDVGRALVEAVGAVPLVLEAAEHDRAVAATSHLPFVAAAALVRTVADELPGLAGAVAAGGFRDTTRVAAGSPEMHADICTFNRGALLACIERYQDALEAVKRMIGQPQIEAEFAAARRARLDWEGRAAGAGE
ncbi:MAG: prephenate dehydrogenase [Chloroflexota bacterium]